MHGWRRHFFRTKHVVKTTWRLRLVVVASLLLAVVPTRTLWADWIGRSLVCPEDVRASDAALIENFDPNYLLFERTAESEKHGLVRRTFVPVASWRDTDTPNAVSRGIAEVMARQARLRAWELVPFHIVEPISLNAARQVRERLVRENVTSVIVVAPGFRSRRSQLVYRTAFNGELGRIGCQPVFGTATPQNWTETWHGIQEVVLEFAKLQYYRMYVLPFRNGNR